jgi:hypothetical protein
MSLTNRQAFKFGFLLQCASEGLSVEETRERIKEAAVALGKMEKSGQGIGAAIGSLGRGAMGLGGGALRLLTSLGWLGMGVGGLAGLGGGYTLGKMTEKETDPEEVKRQELIAAYQQEADRLRRAAQRRMYRPAAPRKPRLS